LAIADHLRTMVRMAVTRYRPDRDAWYLDFIDEDGKRRNLYGGKTRGEAEVALALRVSKLAVVRAGLVSRQQYELSQWAQSDVSKMLDEYLRSLRGRRRTDKHVREVERMVRVWIAATKVGVLDDVFASATEAWLSDGLDDERQWSYRTRNAYLSAVSGFMSWLVKHGRLAVNPLLCIPVLNTAEDERNPSRSLTQDEFAALLDASPDRRLYYLFGGRMGLRWSETARLKWAQIDGDYLLLDAASTKNRRADPLPIPSVIQSALAHHPRKSDKVFAGSPTTQTWKRDLVRAGIIRFADAELKPTTQRFACHNLIGYETHDGQVDRKCLRKTFCTHLASAGVDLRTAQRLMRHSDPRLTANIYTDPALLDMRGAVESLGADAPQTRPRIA